MIARRIFAVPLIVIGGLLYAATCLAAVVVGLYASYVGIKEIAEGDIAAGLGVIFVTGTAVTFVLHLLMLPAAGMLAAGEWLWGGAVEPADTHSYEDGRNDDDEDEDDWDDDDDVEGYAATNQSA